MEKTSQESGDVKKSLPLKSKDFKVKFRHYSPREKRIKVIVDVIGGILIISLTILIILSIIEGQYIFIALYGTIITIFLIISESVEHKLKKNTQKRIFGSIIMKSQIKYPTRDKGIMPAKEQDILVFVSYATKDAEIFKIKEISKNLSKRDKINNVLYWQENMKDNIIKYMNDNLGKCDVMLLFCSPNALASEPVEKEWTAADIMRKPIIPIFNDPDHIPPLLKTRLGVKFDPFDFQKNTHEIYNLILKKIS
jgi:hypothetical protein